jgi:NADH:ubiquinone oxidoreductase subunit 4 (subunit M)
LISIEFQEKLQWIQMELYLAGVFVSYLIGFWVLYSLRNRYTSDRLNLLEYQGIGKTDPWKSRLFFLSVLGNIGFPISSTFLGEDLLLKHLESHDWIPIFLFSLGYFLSGITGMRLYTKIFLGPLNPDPSGREFRNA